MSSVKCAPKKFSTANFRVVPGKSQIKIAVKRRRDNVSKKVEKAKPPERMNAIGKKVNDEEVHWVTKNQFDSSDWKLIKMRSVVEKREDEIARTR